MSTSVYSVMKKSGEFQACKKNSLRHLELDNPFQDNSWTDHFVLSQPLKQFHFGVTYERADCRAWLADGDAQRLVSGKQQQNISTNILP